MTIPITSCVVYYRLKHVFAYNAVIQWAAPFIGIVIGESAYFNTLKWVVAGCVLLLNIYIYVML